MKTRLAIIVIGVLAIGVTLGLAQSKRSRAAKEFMRDKLEFSQSVLGGVVIEDWDLVIAKGTKLSAMTQEADWRVFENPNYEAQSTTTKPCSTP